jgi:AcrR family transcriptional regulator
MTDQERAAREARIEAAAYAVLAERGYAGASMLTIARRARASNETLYRWYGDKTGLFAALVRRNAADSAGRLRTALDAGGSPLHALRTVAPVLLAMVLGERAVALNRAAASDPTGELGRIIAEGGRARILPLLADLIGRAEAAGELPPGVPSERADVLVSLLIGDRQIRRVIGSLPEPAAADVAAQADAALRNFVRLCHAGDGNAPERAGGG